MSAGGQDSNGFYCYTHVFDVGEHDCTNQDAVHCKKYDIKFKGPYQKRVLNKSYISACRQDSNAIPTATPEFSRLEKHRGINEDAVGVNAV